jgi:hypothetical protein
MSCNVSIDDIPFVNTWHGKPGVALPPQHSSAGNGASGLIAGLPSSTYSARNASACSRCVAAHRRTPCQFGVIADHLPPRPTSPPTQRYQTIPSAIVASRYHRRSGADDTNNRVVAQVEGTGPVLPILGGGAVYAPLILGYTDCCGSSGSSCWGRAVAIHSLPLTPQSCHSYPTRLPVLPP